MQNDRIIIVSRAIGTGKTTELGIWLKKKTSVGGFLTPVVNGKRVLLELATRQVHRFEADDDSDETFIPIGKYRFLAKSFAIGQDLMMFTVPSDFFIVDEIGKLEIEFDKGFEPAISTLILLYQNDQRKGTLLLVIRDTLLEKSMEKYQLHGARVVTHVEEIDS